MSIDTRFRGILPALITPFTADGSAVDADAMAALVERCIAAGVGGLVPTGSTGEFPTMSSDERRLVTETVVEAAAGRVPTIPGTGALSTAEAVALSVHAEQSGAAAVMVAPPFYEAPTWSELLAHYAAIADRIAIPIVYYNIPGATGTDLTLENFRELRDVAGVTCFKDTSGDAVTATELFQLDDVPAIINGWDTLTFGALAAGMPSAIWGAASFMPEQCVELHRLLIEDVDLLAARELWARMWPVCRFLETSSYSAAVKTACELVGLKTGPLRAPLQALDADQRRELGERLERAGVAVGSVSAT